LRAKEGGGNLLRKKVSKPTCLLIEKKRGPA